MLLPTRTQPIAVAEEVALAPYQGHRWPRQAARPRGEIFELGMELEGEAPIEGRWVDRVNGLGGVRVDIAMTRTPVGHGRLELTKLHAPKAVSAEPENAMGNTLGLRSIMFAVDDIDSTVVGLRAHGAELVGEVAQ